MKTALAFLAALLVIVPAATAAPTACSMTSLDNYLAASFSCTIDNLLFSNFSYSPSANPSGIAIPASGIEVTPLTMLGDEGLKFTSGWGVKTQSDGSSSFQDSAISFTVSTNDHSLNLTDLSLSFNGDFTGTGTTRVNESYCPGGAVSTCAGGASVVSVTNPPLNLTSPNIVFAHPVSTLGITKDIFVASGTNGTAGISIVTNNFSNNAVPEPATCLLIGGGLLGLGLLRRSRRA